MDKGIGMCDAQCISCADVLFIAGYQEITKKKSLEVY